MDVKYKHARLGGRRGACSPRKILEIRCSEIASDVATTVRLPSQNGFGSQSIVSTFWLSMYACSKRADFEFL